MPSPSRPAPSRLRFLRAALIIAFGAAEFWPSAASAQTANMPAIGFLSARTAASVDSLLPAFREGLRETGYVENRNVAIQYRWAEGRFEDLDGLAADLVALKVNVLVATGGNASAIAARKATGDIPIVFAAGGDPLKLGLVSSLSRPTGNVTGVSQLTEALEGKRLELLSVLLPAVRTYDVLMNRKNPTSETSLREISAAARVLKRSVNFSSAGTADEVDAVFAELARRGSKALLVTTDPFLDNRRAQVIALAARHSIPAMYGWREHALAGGLISYGTAAIDSYRQVGRYVGRILGGAKISELPVVSADPRMVINRKTAASLGLSVPRDLLLRADEVID